MIRSRAAVEVEPAAVPEADVLATDPAGSDQPGGGVPSHPRGRLADLHLHSEFSWDAARGSMVESCGRASHQGLRVVAFTDHADRVGPGADRIDVAGYLESIQECRRRFPGLTILSGVELGEPHHYPVWADSLITRGEFDLVLGAVHSLPTEDGLEDSAELLAAGETDPDDLMASYFSELLGMLESPLEFQVLAHLEYPKRYWPSGWARYRSQDHRGQIVAVLEAASRRGLALELNTTRGGDPDRALCPSPEVVSWWRDLGGREVSIGSDAHRPEDVGCGLSLAASVLEAAGFTPGAARIPLWRTTPAGQHT